MERYDKFGHCVKCGKCMVIEQVIDNELQYRFTADYREKELFMNDGSKMRVAICANCRDNLTENDYPTIMKCVYNGWKEEIKMLNWDEKKKDRYLQEYGCMDIVCDAEDKDTEHLKKEMDKFVDKNYKAVGKGK